jgi:predicted nuclease of restriction endonuclease-like (RecB) superfamily
VLNLIIWLGGEGETPSYAAFAESSITFPFHAFYLFDLLLSLNIFDKNALTVDSKFTMPEFAPLPGDFHEVLSSIKNRVRTAQARAKYKANTELISLYFDIGSQLVYQLDQQGWHAGVISSTSVELIREFGHGQGYSVRNLKYMMKFFRTYKHTPKVQQCAALLPWTTNCVILDKLKTEEDREFYLKYAIKEGWGREVLELRISTNWKERHAAIPDSNFQLVIPEQSEQINEILKDNFIFSLTDPDNIRHERHLQRKLIEQIKLFLLELGEGFCFINDAVKLTVEDDNDSEIDLLMFNRNLNCLFIIDLKMKNFQPEFVGKMNYYLELVNQQLRHPHENPPIGLILCKSKNSFKVETSLKNVNSPIAVATYEIINRLEQALEKFTLQASPDKPE